MLYVNKLKFFVLSGAVMALSACADKSADISILSDSDTFEQSTSVNNKIDILWMIDTSGSMAPYQQNLADNFSTFINDFVTKGYDYNMAVAGTDAWVREVNYQHNTCGSTNNSGNPNTMYGSSADCGATNATYGQLTHFRDGDIYGPSNASTRSGNYLITSLMNPTAIINTFAINVKTGIRGDGSERGFQSLRSVLRRNGDGSAGYSGETHTQLANFRRNSAFLAVIIVADEEDVSQKPSGGGAYANTTEYRNSFTSFMDGYTGSSAGNRKYNVSSIVVSDIGNCPGHHAGASQGNRYVSVSNATDGIVGSICDTNFSSNLADIAGRIVELSTRFKLSREPIPSSIVVTVNSVTVPQDATNGWTYVADSGSHYVEFHGSATPAQGAAIKVDFDPVSLE